MAILTPTCVRPRASNALKASLLAGVILAGTGGILQIQPTNIGYAPPHIRFTEGRRVSMVRTQIRRILEGLEVSNAGLARALGVSRQALYNWLNGDLPKESHQSRLNSLSRAYDVLLPIDMLRHAALTQPMNSGQSFWQLVQAGADAETLAHEIKASHHKRSQQRSLVAERTAEKRARGTLANILSNDLG
jgi:transcriptional regulator with XRE-family HTH domain